MVPPITEKVVNLAVIGVGLVGSELLKQISTPQLAHKFKLVFVSNSRHSISSLTTHHSPIPFSDWKKVLNESTAPAAIGDLPRLLGSFVEADPQRLINPYVVVDNTSSEEVAALYPAFLRHGIHVVTPNKKAYSGDLKLYVDIAAASAESGAKFLNESTVGAGLPIISTLKDLVATGDKIYKIEGVLSGTLSYIFNEYSSVQGADQPFSTIVRVAREKGYTEPHPGDDLNGADVARKLTILSRLIPELKSALPQGYKSVSITSLVPDELSSPDTNGDEFVKRLPEFDPKYDALKKEAANNGKVLRYAGVIDVAKQEIKASLEQYPTTHAFATSLGGSDNILAFHTERYSPRPLIVQGAGAGAAVTAMGVLSDILKLL